jgi:hypothetical protein
MIKRLAAFDFDGTLINSPEKETGKVAWSEKMGQPHPYPGWWGRPESLDLTIFDIKPFPSVLNQLHKEQSTPDTYVIILTSRMEKLRPQVQAVLDVNKIHVNKLDMKRSEKTKGQKILDYINQLPDLTEINVYEDRDTDIESYESIRVMIPDKIKFNIYFASNGTLKLLKPEGKLTEIIKEEIENIAKRSVNIDKP